MMSNLSQTNQNQNSKMIKEIAYNLRNADVWHYKNTDTNEFLPLFIEKSYFLSNQHEGYRLWNDANQTHKIVAYFESFQDAKDFIYQAYSTPVAN